MTDIYNSRYLELLLPSVRVRSGKALGSGTVIYSQEDGDSRSTYVLTNQHVVDDLIRADKRWSALLKREIKTAVTYSRTRGAEAGRFGR